MVDSSRSIVDLDMDRSEVVMRVVLVPAGEHASLGLDPIDPIMLVRVVGSKLKPDLYSSLFGGIPLIVQKRSRIRFADDSIRSLFARFSAPSSYVAEL